MTADTPQPPAGARLSEEERDDLCDAATVYNQRRGVPAPERLDRYIVPAVERILAARQSATEDGLRAAVEALADEWEAAMDVPERGVFDPSAARLRWAGGELRALLAAHPEPGEAASVGDGLAGFDAVVDYADAETERANAADAETARLRAKVERVEALAARWRCNCGGPSPEGHHEMHCDSYYGDVLRVELEDGDR